VLSAILFYPIRPSIEAFWDATVFLTESILSANLDATISGVMWRVHDIKNTFGRRLRAAGPNILCRQMPDSFDQSSSCRLVTTPR